MSFDTLAPVYRGMELVLAGRVLQRCRETFLAAAGGSRRALLLGEGPGRFLIPLLKSNHALEATCLDRSPRMIREAIHNLDLSGVDVRRVEFLNVDAMEWRPHRSDFDLVATHFFLDCFRPEQLRSLIPKISACLNDNAAWIVSDFRLPDRGWRRLRARWILAAMYGFFRIAAGLAAASLTPPDSFLEAAGLRLRTRRLFNHEFIYADLWVRQ